MVFARLATIAHLLFVLIFSKKAIKKFINKYKQTQFCILKICHFLITTSSAFNYQVVIQHKIIL